MIVMRFWLASDLGNLISLIGIIISIIIFFVGNKEKNKLIVGFATVLAFAIIIMLFINRSYINKNYVEIPFVHGLTVDSAKQKLVDNGVNIHNVIFNSIGSNSLPEGVTEIIDVDPACGEIVKKTSVINIFYEEGIKKEEKTNTIDPLKELIIAINEQLSDGGLALDEEDLRAFVCMLNEDYESINEDCLFRVIESFGNIDWASANLLAGIDVTDDHMSSISAIYGAFFREKDLLFVEYWITRFEELKRKIYLHENMESIYHEIDEFGVDLYLTFCCDEPIQINNEKISIRALREETVFFLQEILVYNMAQYLINVHGNSSQEYLQMKDPVSGENVMISVDRIIDELFKQTNKTQSYIVYKIKNKS